MSHFNKENQHVVMRGAMYYADLSPVIGSEQGGIRPVLVIQNDMGNKYSPTIIVAAITSRNTKATLPTHVSIEKTDNGIKQDSVVLTEQIRTIDKKRLREYIGHLDTEQMMDINRAMATSLGLFFST